MSFAAEFDELNKFRYYILHYLQTEQHLYFIFYFFLFCFIFLSFK